MRVLLSRRLLEDSSSVLGCARFQAKTGSNRRDSKDVQATRCAELMKVQGPGERGFALVERIHEGWHHMGPSDHADETIVFVDENTSEV